MFGNDYYFEMPAPMYLETEGQLAWSCEVLNRNHLGVKEKPFHYLGLFPDFDSIDYEGELEIDENTFERLFDHLEVRDDFKRNRENFHKRRDTHNYLLRYNPLEQ